MSTSTCKVLHSVLIFSEMSAARPSPARPLARPLSRTGLRWASRPCGLCPRHLSLESDPLDVSIFSIYGSTTRGHANLLIK